MTRAVLIWARRATCRPVSHLSWAQLACFRTYSTNKTSSLGLHRRNLHGPYAHHAEFHSTEQMMDSTSVDRERYPSQRNSVCRDHISVLTRTQALILTLTRVADGFAATSWSGNRATLNLISTRFAGGSWNYVLGHIPLQLTTRKKGASTGSSFSPLTTQNVWSRRYPSRWQDHLG